MNEDVLEQIANKIVDSIEKYLDKDSYPYERIFKLASSPKSDSDISDLQWTLIIDST